MERFLFSKIPAWVTIAVVLASLIGMIGVAMLVYDHLAGPKRFGPLSRAAGFVGGLPEQTFQSLKAGNPMRARRTERFDGRGGWAVAPEAGLEGYLLLSRHDGDIGAHRVDLLDLSTMEIAHSWIIDAAALFAAGRMTDDTDEEHDKRRRRFRAIHPIALDDGDLIIKDHDSPLFRIDACADLVWSNFDLEFHHTTERAPEGGFWIPDNKPASAIDLNLADHYLDTSVARVSEDGAVVGGFSLTEALVEAGLMPTFMFVRGMGARVDPIHLNDIEPVLESGPYWKRGDLFLSMRHNNMVALYRPGEARIVWSKVGPWMAQHDVDIVGDRKISVFSNNTYNGGNGTFIRGKSEILVYDFSTDTVTSPFAAASEAHDILTPTEGLVEWLPNGVVMIEEENSGRIVFISPDQQLVAEFINRAADGEVYRLGWSRYMDTAAGDLLAETLRPTRCGG